MNESEWLANEDDPQRMLSYLLAERMVYGGQRPSDRNLRLFACACCRQVWDLLTDDVPCDRCGESTMRCSDGYYTKMGHGCSGTGSVNRSRRAVEVAERYADGQATEEELAIACHAAWEVMDGIAWSDCRPHFMSWTASGENDSLAGSLSNNVILNPASPAVQAALLREVFGNPFRPVPRINRHMPDGKVEVRRSDGAIVVADRDRLPIKFARQEGSDENGVVLEPTRWLTANVLGIAQGIYDERAFDRMPILGDALEDAGCDNEEVLRHCRGEERCYWLRNGELCSGGNTISPCNTCFGSGWCPLRGPHVRGCWLIDILLGKS